MEVNSNVGKIFDANQDGNVNLHEVRTPALKTQLAKLSTASDGSLSVDSAEIKALKENSSVQAARTELQQNHDNLAKLEKKAKLPKTLEAGGVTGMVGGMFIALAGAATAGLAVVVAGAIASVASLGTRLASGIDEDLDNAKADIGRSEIKLENAMAEALKANAQKSVATGPASGII